MTALDFLNSFPTFIILTIIAFALITYVFRKKSNSDRKSK